MLGVNINLFAPTLAQTAVFYSHLTLLAVPFFFFGPLILCINYQLKQLHLLYCDVEVTLHNVRNVHRPVMISAGLTRIVL